MLNFEERRTIQSLTEREVAELIEWHNMCLWVAADESRTPLRDALIEEAADIRRTLESAHIPLTLAEGRIAVAG
jgi:hypothetical protein